jgi:hypothetical protein
MRCLVSASGVLFFSGFLCFGEPVQALRFEGLWNLNGPDALKPKLDFQVNGENIDATYYHPFPSTLSDIQIQGDQFTATYLDEFASSRTLTARLRGNTLEVAVEPRDGQRPLVYAGSRIPPGPARTGTHQRVGGSFNTSGKSANGEFVFNRHTVVFSGGMEGNCVSGSVGADGKGASMNGCLSVSKSKP